MNIAVLNGSPKGNLSITMQSVNFIQKIAPQHSLKIHNIAEKINQIESSEKLFNNIFDDINNSDGVLWVFPVYYFLIPSQYKRFIELIFEREKSDIFKDKYTAALSTSVHFYDHAAHNYINAICDDLNMKYVTSHSADMYDLLKERERNRLAVFAQIFFEAIINHSVFSKQYKQITTKRFIYNAGNVMSKIDLAGKHVIIITDSYHAGTNLYQMITRFKESFSNMIDIVDLNKMDIKGGCLGCIQCGFDNVCVYDDKDSFSKFYNTKLKTADIIIFAGSITDRFLSSSWKLFFDRSFFNTHIPSLTGKQIGFLISGALKDASNLKQILQAYVECEGANCVDFISDEYHDSIVMDDLLQSFVERVVSYSDKRYVKPPTFLSIGGIKVLRDEIWGRLRFVFQADHKFYKKHGLYDFPQKNTALRIVNEILILFSRMAPVRKFMFKRMREEMVRPHQKLIQRLKI